MDIREALGQLDTMEDKDWTAEGQPAVERVSELMGEKVTRQQITNAAPHFTRQNTELEEVIENAVQEEEGRTEEVTDENINEYLAGEPMDPHDLLKFMQKVGSGELSAFEKVFMEQLSGIEQNISKLNDFRFKVKYGLGLVRARMKVETPDVDNQTAIMNYIRKQNVVREEKAVVQNELLKKLDIKKLDPRAPIDRAFARKTQRGGKRPTR